MLTPVRCFTCGGSIGDLAPIFRFIRQRRTTAELKAAGASKTLKSRHLTGHAVDLAAMVGKEVRWDFPLYTRLGSLMKQAAQECKVPIDWGGDWKFKDGPHFQLTWAAYP